MKHARITKAHTEHADGLSFNQRIGVFITRNVGTMYAAYLFTLIAFIALPQAIESHSMTVLINWFSGNWMQFVLLPIIIVGQSVASDRNDHVLSEILKDTEITKAQLAEVREQLHFFISTIYPPVSDQWYSNKKL